MTTEHLFSSEQEAIEALYVTNCRILDMLYVLGLDRSPKNASKVIDLHAAGGLMGPSTALDPNNML